MKTLQLKLQHRWLTRKSVIFELQIGKCIIKLKTPEVIPEFFLSIILKAIFNLEKNRYNVDKFI